MTDRSFSAAAGQGMFECWLSVLEAFKVAAGGYRLG